MIMKSAPSPFASSPHSREEPSTVFPHILRFETATNHKAEL